MKRNLFYKFIYVIGRVSFPRAEMTWEDGPADEPAVYVCNHAGVRGPAMMVLDFKRPHKFWVISFTLDRSKCANFAFHDFFTGESRKHKGFWRFISRIVGRLMPHLFSCGDVIPLYHDRRIAITIKQTLKTLRAGEDIVVFAESPKRYSEYINELKTGVADIGYLYNLQTGKKLKFYPVYIERKNKVISIGKPVEYDPSVRVEDQRGTISVYLRDSIDRMARGLKKHKPVPFLPPEWYEYYGRYENDEEGYWKMFE